MRLSHVHIMKIRINALILFGLLLTSTSGVQAFDFTFNSGTTQALAGDPAPDGTSWITQTDTDVDWLEPLDAQKGSVSVIADHSITETADSWTYIIDDVTHSGSGGTSNSFINSNIETEINFTLGEAANFSVSGSMMGELTGSGGTIEETFWAGFFGDVPGGTLSNGLTEVEAGDGEIVDFDVGFEGGLLTGVLQAGTYKWIASSNIRGNGSVDATGFMQLQLTAVPEPSTILGLLAASFATFFIGKHRRKTLC